MILTSDFQAKSVKLFNAVTDSYNTRLALKQWLKTRPRVITYSKVSEIGGRTSLYLFPVKF